MVMLPACAHCPHSVLPASCYHFPLPQRQWWWKWESLPESDVRRASKRGTQVGWVHRCTPFLRARSGVCTTLRHRECLLGGADTRMLYPTSDYQPPLPYCALPHTHHSLMRRFPYITTRPQDFLWTPHVQDLQPDSPNYERSVR